MHDEVRQDEVKPVILDSDVVEELVTEIWNDVIKSINDVVKADSAFGFSKFEIYANPSIEEIVHAVSVIEFALGTFLSVDGLSVEAERVLLNCQQSLHLIRRVYASLKHKDEAEYQDCIRKLTAHRG